MKTLVFLFLLIPVISLGQEVRWDFENNDLTKWYQNVAGRWEVSNEEAIDGTYSLHHAFDNDTAGADWIALFHEPLLMDEAQTVWQFSVRYKYKPSANNNWAVMLAESNLTGDDKLMDYALILGVNYRGSDDEIRLWKQKGEKIESILSTGINWEENIKPDNPVSFKITRTINGVISIEIYTSGGSYFKIGETIETEITQSQFFLIYYKYTSSYDRGLYFDDLIIHGKFYSDITSPQVKIIHTLSPKNILVEYNEIVHLNEGNEFCVEGAGCGTPQNTIGRYFQVDLPYNLHPGESYTLKTPEVSDMYDNKISANEQNVEFYYPTAYDVVIDEILADPSPPVMLPETEFIEVMNTTQKAISLFDWQIMVNNRKAVLPKNIIGSGEYLIFLDADAASGYQNQKYKAIGIEDFPTLSNEGAKIILLDASGRMMHAVDYSNKWYESDEKKEGGWSLEMINPKDPCSGEENWKESVDYHGGTPGEPNSVYSDILLNKPPELWRAAVTDSSSLMLYFSEPMDSMTLALKDFYFVDHDMGTPVLVRPNWPIADKVELFFNKQFEKKVEYKISLSSDPCNCLGLSIGTDQSARFRLPEQSDSSDIVINEIMFDPRQDLEEYIEFYNQSDKTIDLKGCQLITGDPVNKGKMLTNDYFPMAPGSYAALSKDYSGIDSEEEFEHAELIVKMPDMPTLSNEGSKIILLNKQSKTLDVVTYSPAYHHPILYDTKGVSLERISPEVSGLEPGNWQSASSDVGYQTPAAPNSQSELLVYTNKVTVSPETITPNADGIGDELSVCYQMDGPGYMARVFVFDKNGKRIVSLANGKILGTSGCYAFQGKGEDGSMLKTGFYVLYFEAYNDSGKRFVIKKAFVVAE